MPYIHVRITDEGVSDAQKAAIVAGATDLMVDVLGKDPETTHVVIEEVPLANWGVGGLQAERYRERQRSARG
jgi:4-oxalocrotonate tautomerase